MNKKLLSSLLLIPLLFSCNGNTPSSSSDVVPSDIISFEENKDERIVFITKYPSLKITSSPVNLDARILNSTYSEVVYESSDSSIASLNNNVLSVHKIGKCTIKAYIKDKPEIKDSFELNVSGTVLTGTIKDVLGNPIVNANISYGELSTKSASDGKYSLTIAEIESDAKLIIKKNGFNERSYDIKNLLIDGEIVKNVVLYSPSDRLDFTFKAQFVHVFDGKINDVSLKINNTPFYSDNEGNVTSSKITIGSSFNIAVEKEGYLSYTRTYQTEDFIDNMEDGSFTIDLGILELYSHQESLNIFNKNSHRVTGNVLRGINGIKTYLKADFDIATTGFNYEMFFDFGTSNPSDLNRSDPRDCDINIEFKGITKKQHYSGGFGEGEVKFDSYIDGKYYVIEVEFPYSYLKTDKDEIFGFNIISHDSGVSDRSMNLFGNVVEWYNYYSYPRVGLHNEIYQANTNNDPSLMYKNATHVSPILGNIGVGEDYEYSLKIAKDDNGLYFIHDKINKTKPLVQEGTMYHIFIDTEQTNINREADNKVKHFSIETARWLKMFSVKDKSLLFENEITCPDLILQNCYFETRLGHTVLFVPYALLGINASSSIGVAANVEQGSQNWTAWQAPYITNKDVEPHAEDCSSYVRLSSNLEVII